MKWVEMVRMMGRGGGTGTGIAQQCRREEREERGCDSWCRGPGVL
jgi:hypothetical protein